MPEVEGGGVLSGARRAVCPFSSAFFSICLVIVYCHLRLYLYYEEQICYTRELSRSTFIDDKECADFFLLRGCVVHAWVRLEV